MRVVVVGASGNVGTSVVAALSRDPGVEEILGLARRLPALGLPKLRWARADVVDDDLGPHFRGADAVVHLAWAIQPQHEEELLERINVEGIRRVFDAVLAAGVPSLVYASSVGAYSAGPKDRAVGESWPTDGIAGSIYSRQKAAVERLLDGVEAVEPELRVVRLRPGLIFKAEAASEIRRAPHLAAWLSFLNPRPTRPSFLNRWLRKDDRGGRRAGLGRSPGPAAGRG